MKPPIPTILALFDIDGTLLDTQDAGIRAYELAGAELLGKPFEYSEISVHGRLDSENYRAGMELHAPGTSSDQHLSEFKSLYHHHLQDIGVTRGGFSPLPGVNELIQLLHTAPQVEVGILTGNWEKTGTLKIEASGLDPNLFHTSVWAEDGETRDDLVPVAVTRFEHHHGKSPARVVIIGDTPRDVQCAHVHGAEAIAVATGVHDHQQLRETGAECVVHELTDLKTILNHLEMPSP